MMLAMEAIDERTESADYVLLPDSLKCAENPNFQSISVGPIRYPRKTEVFFKFGRGVGYLSTGIIPVKIPEAHRFRIDSVTMATGRCTYKAYPYYRLDKGLITCFIGEGQKSWIKVLID